jgi:hypothetical protein
VPVIIERKGVRYRLAVEKPASSGKSRRAAHIEILDPAVADDIPACAGWSAATSGFTPHLHRS